MKSRSHGAERRGGPGARAAAGLFAAAAAVAASSAASAQSYECTPAPEAEVRVTQVWHRSNRCVPIYIDRATSLFGEGEDPTLVQESADVWTSPGCTDLELPVFGFTDQRPGFDPRSDDNQNVISEVLTASDRGYLPDPEALATTVTFHNADTGEIYDADILFNTAVADFEDLRLGDDCAGRLDPPYDLRNTLVHELGHVLGFDHNADRASTMFASAPVCELSKRDLTSLDLQGLCDVYASGQPSRTCEPASSYGSFDRFRGQCDSASSRDGGCQAVSGTAFGLWWMVVGLWPSVARLQRKTNFKTSSEIMNSSPSSIRSF